MPPTANSVSGKTSVCMIPAAEALALRLGCPAIAAALRRRTG